MASDEPLYCRVCGREGCPDHELSDPGPYCDVCGIVPAAGRECNFYKRGGSPAGCEAADEALPRGRGET